jgi:vaccinia related kinase
MVQRNALEELFKYYALQIMYDVCVFVSAHSRRGDLEILGYNMLQWLCGKLPWEDNITDPEYIHAQKKSFMSNIPLLMRRCFPNSEPPGEME